MGTEEEAEYTDLEQNAEMKANTEFLFYELDTDLDSEDQKARMMHG